MLKTKTLLARMLFAAALVTSCSGAMAQDTRKPETDLTNHDPEAGDDVTRFCKNIAPTANEARLATEMKRLTDLEAQVDQRVAELQAKEAEVREWVNNRNDLLKKAEDGVVAIYSKMDPEAAATQLTAMDQSVAAAIVSKLNPRVASTILDEMDSTKAAAITNLISGSAAADGKKT